MPNSPCFSDVMSSPLSKACENVGDDGRKKEIKRERKDRDAVAMNFPSNQRKGGMRWRGCCLGF